MGAFGNAEIIMQKPLPLPIGLDAERLLHFGVILFAHGLPILFGQLRLIPLIAAIGSRPESFNPAG